ncbi:hypothetical protein [Capnocytophaga sp.]|uniref:hypothetical protein n=1 Tax=Capnocytophaga sp. TaxID=44737 RepID=UPI0026DD8E0E|nr:hypothetical protein [Capnocytophaga sp.]MDO5106443.1 hypothetical protein [Capnocytophaga sp.]
MKDCIAQMLSLQEEMNRLFFEFQKLSVNEQVNCLNEKLDLQQYDKFKTDFLLEMLNRYPIDNEVLIQIWKEWLCALISHEFSKRKGFVDFAKENPQLKSEIIEFANAFVKKNLEVHYTDNQSYIDGIIVYNTALIFWDLGYKTALLNFVKTYQHICDDYFDEKDYLAMESLC